MLIVLSVVVGWYLIIAFLGWQSGQARLAEQRQRLLQEQLDRQVSLAQDDIDQGKYTLAIRRLDWVLDRAPAREDALALRQDAQSALDAQLAPPSFPAETAVPTPSSLPTATYGPIADPEDELDRIQTLVAAEEWEQAVPALMTFQHQFPSYERQTTDEMLYNASISLGLELLQGEQVELGLFYLEQAERLGDLPQEVIDYRTWAELYLQGIAFYGVNWGAATYFFRDLCLAAPFYQSSCERLHESLILYGDQLAGLMDWCPAQSAYAEANRYGRDRALTEKLEQATAACLQATPTPTAPVTTTVPITSSQVLTDSFILHLTPAATDSTP